MDTPSVPEEELQIVKTCEGLCSFACFVNFDSLHVITNTLKCPCREPKLFTLYRGDFLLNSKSKLIHEVAHVCMDAFNSHWRQIQDVFNKYSSVNKALRSSSVALHASVAATNKNSNACSDEETNDLNSVLNNLNSIALLVCTECAPLGSKLPNGTLDPVKSLGSNLKSEIINHNCGPLLAALIKFKILERCAEFCANNSGNNADNAKVQLLNVYRTLLSQAKQPVFIFEPIAKALLNLVTDCKAYKSSSVEAIMLSLLYDLSAVFSNEPKVFQLFSRFSLNQPEPDFLPLSILLVYMYRDDDFGELARRAIYLIFSTISLDYEMIKFVSEKSCFCSVLATGISATYSSLPSILPHNYLHLPVLGEGDCDNVPYLYNFIQAVQFCNSLCNISHKLVRANITDFILAGFLCPIVLPSISQSSSAEAVAATAYLDLFIRTISECSLMKCVVSFVLTTKVDNQSLISLIISRVNNPMSLFEEEASETASSNPNVNSDDALENFAILDRALSTVSLCFLSTIINLKSEDVMLELFLRYLLPGDHILSTQRPSLTSQNDSYGKSVEKFLSLIPSVCRKARHRPLVLNRNSGRPPMANLSVPVQSLSGSVKLQSAKKANQRLQRNTSAPYSNNLSMKESMTINDDDPNDIEVVTLAQFETSYFDCLSDARSRIEECYFATSEWNCKYSACNNDSVSKTKMSNDRSKNSNHHVKLSVTKSTDNVTLDEKAELPDIHPKIEAVRERIENGPSLCEEISPEQFFENLDIDTFVGQKCDVRFSETNGYLLSSVLKESEICDKIDNLLNDSFEEVLNNGVNLNNYEDAELSSAADGLATRPRKLALLKFDSHRLASFDSPLPSIGSPNYTPSVEKVPSLASSKSTQSFSDTLKRQDVDLASSLNSDRLSNFSLSLGSAEAKKAFKNASLTGNQQQGQVYLGPCFAALFLKLENVCENNFHLNLVLTGIFASLAAYPLPLLKSYLLNPIMLFQPSVRTLYNTLQKIQTKVDNYVQNVDNFQELLLRGRYYFANMDRFSDVSLEDFFASDPNLNHWDSGNALNASNNSSPNPNKKFPSMVLDTILRRKKLTNQKPSDGKQREILSGQPSNSDNSSLSERTSVESAGGYFVSVETRNHVMAVIVLEEFVKELAAFCQEHSVTDNST